MPSMYAKLMSRITESSLMEEPVPVRYCFMMLLAMADPKGYVIGTDVAIARRMNVPVADFQRCISDLMKVDPDSNSQEEDGRRVLESDGERGYLVVNYRKYRDTRDEEQRREYMRDYMRKRRNGNDVAPVNSCKQDKPQLANAEGEAEEDEEIEEIPPSPQRGNVGGVTEGRESKTIPTTDQSKRVALIFHRRLTTAWSDDEVRAYKKLGTIDPEDLTLVERYYAKHWPPGKDGNFLRRDLKTFLNNFQGEVDKARNGVSPSGFQNGHTQQVRHDAPRMRILNPNRPQG